MAKVRTGIIGCGNIAKTHAPALRDLDESAFVACCDVDEGRARRLAEEFGAKQTFTDPGEMLRSGVVDAVVVCTPHPAHAPVVVAAAEAGVHVLCEKPISDKLSEAQRMVDAADRAGITFSVIFQRRWWPSAQRVRTAIDDGRLGTLVLAECVSKLWRGPEYFAQDAWRGKWATEGGGVLMNQAVHAIDQEPGGFRLATERGPLSAAEVVVATNGYTGRLTPYLARRVVPVGSFIVATVPLDPAVARRLIPNDRMLSDTRNLLYYFRLSPDRRLVFGGRAAFLPTALEESRALLARGIAEVFPDLGPVALEHAWGGTLGFALDQMPHAGRHEGVTYAVGFGGHGVALASWLGDRIGHALGGGGPWPALTELRFPAVPFYRGRPWFLPLAGAYYGLKDRLV